MTKRAKLYATYQEFLLGLQRVLHRPKEVKITVIEIVGEKRKRNLAFPTCTGVTIALSRVTSAQRGKNQHEMGACAVILFEIPQHHSSSSDVGTQIRVLSYTMKTHILIFFFYKNTNLSSVKRTRCSCVFHSILYLFYPCQIVMRSMISTG